MTANRTQRPYTSPLREEQASRTRERILEAFTEQMIDSSLEDFSIALVAKRAGVSVRTVYHHFPNREAILTALESWFEEQVRFPPMPPELDGLDEYIEACFRGMDAAESLVRAIQASSLAGETRAWTRSTRRGRIERLVRSVSDQLTEGQVKRGTALLQYFFTTNSWRFLKDEAGMDVDEVISTVTWAVRNLLEDLKREAEAGSQPPRGKGAQL